MVASCWLFLYDLTDIVFAYFIIVTYYFNMFLLHLFYQNCFTENDSDYSILNESIYFNLEKNKFNFISLICCIISLSDYKTAR